MPNRMNKSTTCAIEIRYPTKEHNLRCTHNTVQKLIQLKTQTKPHSKTLMQYKFSLSSPNKMQHTPPHQHKDVTNDATGRFLKLSDVEI